MSEIWYGETHKVGEGKYLSLSGIKNLQIKTVARSVCRNDAKMYLDVQGLIKVEAIDYNTQKFNLFGVSRHVPQKHEFSIPVTQLPEHVQDKILELWHELETAMVEYAKEEDNNA